MKKLFVIISMLFAVALSSFAASSIIGIKADNTQTVFSLQKVQTILVVNNGGVSMQVNSKDGKSADGFRTIVFSDVEAGESTQMSEVKLSVYPNPVEKVITVVGLDENADLKIVDMKGTLVKSVSGQSIEVEDLKSGMYLLSVNGKVVKFIKK